MEKIDCGSLLKNAEVASPDKWTVGAWDCYKLGCNCSKCNVAKFVDNCKMKLSVRALVRKFGLPSDEEQSKLENEVFEVGKYMRSSL